MTIFQKRWYTSRTIWLNFLGATVAVVSALLGQSIIQEYPGLAAGLVVVLNIANIAIRLVTTTEVV
jgi:hypothetical protein